MQEIYETGMKPKRFLIKVAKLSLLATANFLKQKWKMYQVEMQTLH